MGKAGRIIKIGAGAITAIVGGIVALKGAKSGKENEFDATLEELGTSTEETETEEIPEAEAEEVPEEEEESES